MSLLTIILSQIMFICRSVLTLIGWICQTISSLESFKKILERSYQNIFYLKLSNNSFTGSLPSSIGNMSLLGTFDVSLNNFSGQVPKELLAGCSRLSSLVLSNNNFSGHFDWLSLINLTELFLLKINHNQFSGAMSNELPNWVFLALLEVSNNNMYGKIPTWICNQTSVSTLFL